ncbi:MAG TPA: matrixin family metalloprotease [Candidatus Limnocylindria bacterium]|nr:matrixin family metalloprotease [Candidatus Limnocylindria bacterium]
MTPAACILFAVLLVAPPAGATVVVPWSETQMLALADDVATGVVEDVESVIDGERVETRARVRVAAVLKGRHGMARMTLRQPGGIVGDLHVGVFGTTPLAEGDTVLIFGRRDRSGGHRPLATGLGVYRTTLDPVRAAAALRQVVADPVVRTGAFTFLGAPPASRWFEFERGLDVAIRTANGDPNLGRTRSDDLVRRAFAAWNNVSEAAVRLRLGLDAPEGPSVAGGVCNGQSVIQFNDPADELLDLTGCSGVLAVGGFCTSATATGPGGATYRVITEGDVVLNRRILDCFSETDVAEVLTHEMGHVLGLGHSSEDRSEPNAALRTATMYFLAHLDGRGAAVRADDIAGLRVLYADNDDDNDRIPNDLDLCPGTPPRAAVDQTGCACVDPGHVPCAGADVCHAATCDRATAQCVVTPIDCTDGEPCLTGTCSLATGCSTAPVMGFDAVDCALKRDFTADACATERVPRRLRRHLLRARTFVSRASRVDGEARERLLERAEVRLTRALRRIDRAADLRRRRPLAADCAEQLRLLIGDARMRVDSRGTASLFDPTPAP